MKLTFWGAAKQVTGSMFLLETESGFRILVDCGMDMENREELHAIYPGSAFPFEASTLNAVVLTHAHVDHSGKIPNLLREGFEGTIYCTAPTLSLAELLLSDSASLHRRILNKLHKRRSKDPSFKPDRPIGNLYTERHVMDALEHFKQLDFDRPFSLTKGVSLRLIPAGHLLGAANVLLEIEEEGKEKRILFSGDQGRKNYPLLPDPEAPPEVDYLVCETTYGTRLHASTTDSAGQLKKIIEETCVERPGRLIIPAFSIGRTQALLYVLNKMFIDGMLPSIKIFADSPLAYRSNQVYEKYHRFLNEEAQTFREDNGSLFDFDNLYYIESNKESKLISNYSEPCIIISSSGMLEGGRIQHHIARNLENPYCTILMIGYSAEGTLGHQLMNGQKSIKVGKNEVPIVARIAQTDAFSGHADRDDLLSFVESQLPDRLQKLFLVHGEEPSMNDFKSVLEEKGYSQVVIPGKGEEFLL